MGLKEELEDIASYVINTAMENTAVSITYKSRTGSSYNPIGPVGSNTTHTFTSKAVKAGFGMVQEDAIRSEQNLTKSYRSQCVVAGKDLGAIIPQSGDQIVKGSETWTVEKVDHDASRATYLLTVRLP